VQGAARAPALSSSHALVLLRRCLQRGSQTAYEGAAFLDPEISAAIDRVTGFYHPTPDWWGALDESRSRLGADPWSGKDLITFFVIRGFMLVCGVDPSTAGRFFPASESTRAHVVCMYGTRERGMSDLVSTYIATQSKQPWRSKLIGGACFSMR
jgi:hypothetical protein